jgi:DNA-binding NarL/FixJ family response regulator
MKVTVQEAGRKAAVSAEMPKAIDIAGRPVRLTPTQMKVMRGVHSGQLNKQIAYELGIAEATVKAHMTALMRKLNVRNRTQVAIAAEAMAHPLS